MKLKWLKDKPNMTSGITWGTPWKKGALQREDSVSLINQTGECYMLQTWPMAYWPDGSVKWTGHATVIQPNDNAEFELVKVQQKEVENKLSIKETNKFISIDTGKMECKINKQGSNLIEELLVDGKVIGKGAKMVAVTEVRTENEHVKTCHQEKIECDIKHVEIEQQGTVRCVIKIEGMHRDIRNTREWLPFTIRFYFYTGVNMFRIVHTFFFDGHPESDFIKGLGMEFTLSLTGEPWNRNVRFAGDSGIYSEPGQLLLTRRYKDGDGWFENQIKGELLPLNDKEHRDLLEHVRDHATWTDFKILQDSADHYKITKRTSSGCSWVESTHGTRANGLMFVGGENGGLAIGLKDFWQKHPSSLEVANLLQDKANMTVWFWSPDAEAMDFRHYDKDTHVVSAYEGFDEMRSTPVGIANTSEVNVKVYSSSPTHAELSTIVEEWNSSSLLVCEPEYYYDTNALGVWSLPDSSTPMRAFLETQLDKAITFYQDEIEQRRWYGYWNYGDVMHTYDPIRHQWRYDVGGFAWQNTELVPNIWLWYSFLRSGREDIFRMAEAMTRHTSEVDCYHFGEYAGLGSRHNVVHWGCGCKEARISMAGLHKYYYFLTADERTRDILAEVRDADATTEYLDPMREYFPKDEFPTHTRVGPDWSAFTSNWLSEWERTENSHYRNKILVGIDCLKKMPLGILSGPTFGYTPKTGTLHQMDNGNSGAYHMVIAFGAPQVWMELAQILEDDEWSEMLAEVGEFYMLDNEEKIKRSNNKLNDNWFNLPMLASGMVAYSAAYKQDEELANKAWKLLLDEKQSEMTLPIITHKVESWRLLKEIPTISTNTFAQWCLNTIIALELIGDNLPDYEMKESINHS